MALDYMDMPRSHKRWGYKAVLIIVDQLTRICVCVPTRDKTASTAARILVERWLSFFPDPAFLVSDGGTHFKCKLFEKIAEVRGFQHHIIAPYSQWGNGGAERLNKVTVKAVKAILRGNDKETNEWPAVIPAVQECMNKRMPVSSRDKRTPVELLTGLAPKSAIKHIAWLGVNAVEGIDIPEEQLRANLAPMHDAMRDLWSKAVDAQVKRAARNRRGRKAKVIPRINVGDLVLVAEAVVPDKLDMKWTGPHVVLSCISPFVYTTKPALLVDSKRKPKTVHIVRIRRFSAGALATDADRRAIEQAALRDYPDNQVERFLGHSFDDTRAQKMTIKVRWLGYDRAHDSDEPVSSLVRDVPELVEAYLREHAHEAACARMLRRYFA